VSSEPGAWPPVSERVLGSEHPDTLATRTELAYWTGTRSCRPGT
jgi:hypothetical protein